ncbi:MAG: tRNA 2-selenouridine(34) synthase MnmH [Chitinophagales bacterium]|nr:tRNA 2-selenouridine(34) synthase MnmH [Chitinophagales bacterium]
MVEKLDASSFIDTAAGHPVIDVRSPGEFQHGHIPGAINLPLFSDQERAAIGTLYKNAGREKAMMLGLTFYGDNMRRIISSLPKHTDDKQLFIHCWRGGMRSGVVSWMLDLFGYKVFMLNKGYQSFRRLVLDSFLQIKNIVILGGKTGSAKTDVIRELKKLNEQSIDLEFLAHHKGSAFGNLGESPQPSQEQFENDLFMEFLKMNTEIPIWLEDESQRIGSVNIPKTLWEQMRAARVIYLDIPEEKRLQYIIDNYGNFSREKLKAATLRIQKRLGGLDTTNVINHIERGEIEKAFITLLRYYDRWYEKGIDNRPIDKIESILFNEIKPGEIAESCAARLVVAGI